VGWGEIDRHVNLRQQGTVGAWRGAQVRASRARGERAGPADVSRRLIGGGEQQEAIGVAGPWGMPSGSGCSPPASWRVTRWPGTSRRSSLGVQRGLVGPVVSRVAPEVVWQAGGSDGWHGSGQSEVSEDAGHDVRLGDEGEHDHGGPAPGALQSIDTQSATQQLGPTELAWSDRSIACWRVEVSGCIGAGAGRRLRRFWQPRQPEGRLIAGRVGVGSRTQGARGAPSPRTVVRGRRLQWSLR